MIRFCLGALAAGMILAGAAAAHDTSPDACQVEDWRWYHTKALRALGIEGVAACDSGLVTIRAYDQKDGGRLFLGVKRTVIDGHIFKATILAVDPRPINPVAEFAIVPKN